MPKGNYIWILLTTAAISCTACDSTTAATTTQTDSTATALPASSTSMAATTASNENTVEANLQHRIFDEEIGGPYSNSWDAYPLDGGDPAYSISFLVHREGKDAELVARLEISCKEKSHTWSWGVQYGSEIVDEVNLKESVPNEVVTNIFNKYCSSPRKV